MTTEDVPPSVLLEGDWALDLVLTFADRDPEQAAEQLLATVEFRAAVIGQARRVCLTRLEQRPPNTRDLLRALDIIDQAADRLDARHSESPQ